MQSVRKYGEAHTHRSMFQSCWVDLAPLFIYVAYGSDPTARNVTSTTPYTTYMTSSSMAKTRPIFQLALSPRRQKTCSAKLSVD